MTTIISIVNKANAGSHQKGPEQKGPNRRLCHRAPAVLGQVSLRRYLCPQHNKQQKAEILPRQLHLAHTSRLPFSYLSLEALLSRWVAGRTLLVGSVDVSAINLNLPEATQAEWTAMGMLEGGKI